MRVMPQVLMELMRHESIDTTMAFYSSRNAERTADALWAAVEDGRRIKVKCGYGLRQEPAHQCYYPAYARSNGQPGTCLTSWPGPWTDDQATEAAVIRLCQRCAERTDG